MNYYESKEIALKEIDKICSQYSQTRFGATSGFVLGSVLTSIFIFLSGEYFTETLIDSVNLGGDTDTIGAMVGAVSGAKYGLQSTPINWLESLKAFEKLDDRIEALNNQTSEFKASTSLPDLEMEWTMSALIEKENI